MSQSQNEEIPTIKIKHFKGPYRSSEQDKDHATKQALNQDFSHFINKDVLFRQSYATLRRLAITLFVCAVASLAMSIADIEISREARLAVAQHLNCTDTYLTGWSRFCQPLSTGEGNFSGNTMYFERWIQSYWAASPHYFLACACLKAGITLLTIISVVCFVQYYKAELTVLRLKKYVPFDSSFSKSPKLRSFSVKLFLLCLHIPPLCDAWIENEFQFIVLFRIFICGIKILKECNELRYHRLGNVLSNLARVKIHSTFLIKTYFLRHPKTILFVVYFVVIGFLPYFVVMMERVEGNIIPYLDACWLMVVTVTNLGSGEVRPQSLLARVVVGFGSVIGILSTALWVNVFSKYLDLPNEERRILTIVEHQRCRRIERNTAAMCIQAAWRRYACVKRLGERRGSKRLVAEKMCKKAMWEWKCVRQNITQVRRNLQSNFNTEDTLIVARHMARRMSESRHKPLIVNKSSLSKLTWDRKNSSPFRGFLSGTVKATAALTGGRSKVDTSDQERSEALDEAEGASCDSLGDQKTSGTVAASSREATESRPASLEGTVSRLSREVEKLAVQLNHMERRSQLVFSTALEQIHKISAAVDVILRSASGESLPSNSAK